MRYATAPNIVSIPLLQKGMIDALTALTPICQTTVYQYALMVSAKLPVNNIAELERYPRRVNRRGFREESICDSRCWLGGGQPG